MVFSSYLTYSERGLELLDGVSKESEPNVLLAVQMIVNTGLGIANDLQII